MHDRPDENEINKICQEEQLSILKIADRSHKHVCVLFPTLRPFTHFPTLPPPPPPPP